MQSVVISGWDNRSFRLGDHLVVRLPSAAGYAQQVEKEQQWLPHLAPNLPLAIPEPVAIGKPACGYKHSWSEYRWIDGEMSRREKLLICLILPGALLNFFWLDLTNLRLQIRAASFAEVSPASFQNKMPAQGFQAGIFGRGGCLSSLKT